MLWIFLRVPEKIPLEIASACRTLHAVARYLVRRICGASICSMSPIGVNGGASGRVPCRQDLVAAAPSKSSRFRINSPGPVIPPRPSCCAKRRTFR